MLEGLGILRNVRSEYGKAIRKQYEKGEFKISRHKFLEKEIREDGISNTIDSVQKDNMLAVEVKADMCKDMNPIGSVYSNASRNPSFKRGIYDAENGVRRLKAEQHDTSVVLEVNVKEATSKGYAIARGGRDAVNFAFPSSETRRGRVSKDMANTLDTQCNQGIFVKISPNLTVYAVWYPKKQCYVAIRRLTPKECFRLQGVSDEMFERAEFVNSDSQLYKQAGNACTVNVIHDIAERIGEEHESIR